MKTHQFKFKRVVSRLPAYFGTFILNTSQGVFIGKYDDLYILQNRLGGSLKRLNIIDNFLDKKG